MTKQVPPAWVRRPLTIAILLVAGLLLPVVWPLAIAFALVADLVSRRSGMKRTRTVLLVGLLVIFELCGLALIFLIWLTAPLGYRMHRPRTQRACQLTMNWWAGRLLYVTSMCIPLRIDTDELDRSLLDGNAIVIGRHRSVLDAIVPAGIFGRLGYTVLYSLKEDLRWEPNIDLVGHIMGHRFVTRSPEDLEAELAPLRAMSGRLDDKSVAVIFPEGTFFDERRKARIVESLRRRDPEHAEAAADMQHLLAPRPGGTLALLDGAPTADVIVLGHVGYESFGSLKQIFAAIGIPHRVRIKAWRIPRTSVPDDEPGRIDWLFETWTMLDEWIAEQHAIGDVNLSLGGSR